MRREVIQGGNIIKMLPECVWTARPPKYNSPLVFVDRT